MTDDEMTARCPYCQGDALTRLVESDALPVDVFRCSAAARSSTSIVSAAMNRQRNCGCRRMTERTCGIYFHLAWVGRSMTVFIGSRDSRCRTVSASTPANSHQREIFLSIDEILRASPTCGMSPVKVAHRQAQDSDRECANTANIAIRPRAPRLHRSCSSTHRPCVADHLRPARGTSFGRTNDSASSVAGLVFCAGIALPSVGFLRPDDP
jgi:hypothetical protein